MKCRVILLLMTMGTALVLSSGVALALNTIQCQQPENLWCVGTDEDDRMLGTDGWGSMLGRGGDDILRAFGGDDGLNGEEGNDRLFGGLDKDTFSPGPGDDAISGGAGHDNYWYASGRIYGVDSWGHDTITDPDSGNGPIHFAAVEEDLTIHLASSEERPEVATAGGESTINWSGNVIDSTTGGQGDDTIYGNAAANNIFAAGSYANSPSGDDTIFVGEGDDIIWVTDYDGNTRGDRVDCGGGIDTVSYEKGDKVIHCEIKHRSDYEKP